jgi:hypothetical protein
MEIGAAALSWNFPDRESRLADAWRAKRRVHPLPGTLLRCIFDGASAGDSRPCPKPVQPVTAMTDVEPFLTRILLMNYKSIASGEAANVSASRYPSLCILS